MKVITVKPEEQLVIVVSASLDDRGKLLQASRLYEFLFSKENGTISVCKLEKTQVSLDR
jgi:hypothetical protein